MEQWSNCLNASKTKIGRKFLKDDNYDVDEVEEKYTRFMNGKTVLRKSQQNVKIDRHNILTIKRNKITLSKTSFEIFSRLNSIHYYFIIKIPNKRELKQIVFNHSSDIRFSDFIKVL